MWNLWVSLQLTTVGKQALLASVSWVSKKCRTILN